MLTIRVQLIVKYNLLKYAENKLQYSSLKTNSLSGHPLYNERLKNDLQLYFLKIGIISLEFDFVLSTMRDYTDGEYVFFFLPSMRDFSFDRSLSFQKSLR